jgi:hypothetical protein
MLPHASDNRDYFTLFLFLKHLLLPYLHQTYHYIKKEYTLQAYNLPQNIRNLSNDTKQFKLAQKNYGHAHSLYSIDEYFNLNRE